MYRFRKIALVLTMVVVAAEASSATITNLDDKSAILYITQRSDRGQLHLRSGDTVDFCLDGCFVTYPNGDRDALDGSEIIELSNGFGTDKKQ